MKRYNAVYAGVYDNSVMVEEHDGDWVWYEDVEALQSKCEELQSKCAELLEALKKLEQDGQGYCICYEPSVDYEKAWDNAEAAISKAEGSEK